MRLSCGVLSLALCLGISSASAQAVRGTVVDDAGRPVSGVVVLLEDAASREVARSLSGDAGEYRVAATAPGSYRLRTLRIGFRSLVTPPLVLGAGDEVTRQLALSTIVFALDTVRAIGRNACRVIAGDSTSVVAAVWDQVRNALLATQLTLRARSLYITTLTFDRTLEPLSQRIGAQRVDVHADYARQPWRPLDADTLRRRGYVYSEGEVRTYNAPDLDVLLSMTFLEDHCLRIADGSTRARLGIEFAPNPDRRNVAEVTGTLWLDRATSELRELEYRYVNVPRDEERLAGGMAGFTRMRNGMWAISRWSIRMPMFVEYPVFNSMRTDRKVDSVKVTGGELVMAVVVRGANRDTVWTRPALSLRGVVTDSISRRPVANAVVVLDGTIQLDTTDARGRFEIHGVLPGRYTASVSTPSLDSVGAISRHSVLFADTSMTLSLQVPSAALVAGALARLDSISRTTATASFTGVVVDTAGAPLAGVDVQLPAAGATARTDSAGRFRITGVPPGEQRLIARRVGYGMLETDVALVAGRTTERRIVLTRITLLDSVLSKASLDRDPLMRLFEERRRMGLGHFVTRDEIMRMEGALLSSLLVQIPGLHVISSQGQEFMEGGRPTKTNCSKIPTTPPRRVPPESPFAKCLAREGVFYVPDKMEQDRGIPVACYSRVYLDGQLMNPGRPTPPWDMREIPPTRVEAVELYAGATQVPVEFMARNSVCGLIVIHTRRPR